MEKRTTSDILYSIESKIDVLNQTIKMYELNLKILSNKMNLLMDILQKSGISLDEKMKSKEAFISPENNIPVYSPTSVSTQVPESISGPISEPTNSISIANPTNQKDEFKEYVSNNVQITQRILDSANKAVFLAEVEVLNKNNITILKTRTNGVGKWFATLAPDTYKIIVRKREKNSPNMKEAQQTLVVSGKKTSEDLEFRLL